VINFCAVAHPVTKHLRLAPLFLPLLLGACNALTPPPPVTTPQSQCLADLGLQGIRFERASLADAKPQCHVDNPVTVTAAGVAWDKPGIVDCDFALRLEAFTREAVEPAAQTHFGQSVVRLHQVGTYSCHLTGGGKPSQHSTGGAIDISGFDLADGTSVMVGRDWLMPGPASNFLHDVARRACFYFTAVLTPDSSAGQAGHIHLDAGPYVQCDRSYRLPEAETGKPPNAGSTPETGSQPELNK
jgi:hypothetical protein